MDIYQKITFEFSAFYFQKENGIAKQKGWTLIEHMKYTIISGKIFNKL